MAELDFYVDIHLHKQQLIEARFQNTATAPTSPNEGQIYFNTSTKRFLGWNGTEWVDISQVVTNALTIKGDITNANTNPAFPASPAIGDVYFITTNAGTVEGIAVDIGDQLVYASSGWFIVEKNLQQATQSLAGYVRFATQSEANAGSSTTLAISPATLAGYLEAFLYTRKSVVSLGSITANTPTTVVHGLDLADASHFTLSIYQGGNQIFLNVAPDTINQAIITSNATLSNLTFVFQG